MDFTILEPLSPWCHTYGDASLKSNRIPRSCNKSQPMIRSYFSEFLNTCNFQVIIFVSESSGNINSTFALWLLLRVPAAVAHVLLVLSLRSRFLLVHDWLYYCLPPSPKLLIGRSFSQGLSNPVCMHVKRIGMSFANCLMVGLSVLLKTWQSTLTTFTQVWVLIHHVYQVVLSSVLTKIVLKITWLLDQWLGPTFPMDLVCIPAYLGCIQDCSGFPSSTPMFPSYGTQVLHDCAMICNVPIVANIAHYMTVLWDQWSVCSKYRTS